MDADRCSPTVRSRPGPLPRPLFGSLVLLLAAVLVASPAFASPHTPAGTPVPRDPDTSAAGSPPAAGPIGTLVVNITNPGATATGPFDQLLHVDSAEFANLINSNWSNGAAFYALNGTPIYAWIQSNASNTSTHTDLWVRLDSIAPLSEVSVALEFDAKSTFLLSESGTIGESPLLSPSYAEYDNGWRVFNLYDNFSGTSLNSR
jgi:hypothetical protein